MHGKHITFTPPCVARMLTSGLFMLVTHEWVMSRVSYCLVYVRTVRVSHNEGKFDKKWVLIINDQFYKKSHNS